MTAAGVVSLSGPRGSLPSADRSLQIMAQLGMFVSAATARSVFYSFVPACMLAFALIMFLYASICPVDTILTRMGAYDNMFSNASTFKVELDEWFASSLPKFGGHYK